MRHAWWLGQTNDVSPFFIGILILALWSSFWTGLSLWHAAKRGEKGWFILFLLMHTAGIIEFVYLFFVAKVFETPQKRKSSKRRK